MMGCLGISERRRAMSQSRCLASLRCCRYCCRCHDAVLSCAIADVVATAVVVAAAAAAPAALLVCVVVAAVIALWMSPL